MNDLTPGDLVVWRTTPEALWKLLHLEPNGTAVIWHSSTRSARVTWLDQLSKAP